MKFFLPYIILAVSFISCKKDDDANSDSWGTASALKNGEKWTGEPSAIENYYPSDTGIIIAISAIKREGFKEDFFSFFKVPISIDKHNLSLTTVLAMDSLVGAEYNTLLSHGDVFGDIYYLLADDPVEDFIEITEISGDEIKGNFQVSFLRNTTSPPVSPSTPDTIVFTGGKFHTKIRN